MPETRPLAGTMRRLACLGISSAALIWVSPPATAADSLASRVRSCALETDATKRLECFDRVAARLADSAATAGQTEAAPATAAAGSGHASTATASAAQNAPVAATESVKTDGAAEPRRITARVLKIDYFPNEMIVHLDNDQTWAQIQETSSELTLRAGDAVTLEKSMGAWWLSARNGDSMKVKLKK